VGGAGEAGGGARLNGCGGLLGRVDAALADHGHVRERGDDLAQQLQVRAVGLDAVTRVAGQGRGHDVHSSVDGALGVLEGAAVSHDESAVLAKGRNGLSEAQAVQARAAPPRHLHSEFHYQILRYITDFKYTPPSSEACPYLIAGQ